MLEIMRMSARDLVIELCIMLAIALVVAYLGPFGSFQLGGYERRLLYWGTMVFGGYAIVRPLMLLAPGLAARLQLPELGVWLGLVGISALPVTLLVWSGTGAGRLPTSSEFLRLYPNVLIIGVLVAMVFWVLRRKGPTSHPDAAPSPAPSPETQLRQPQPETGLPRLMQRLPPGKRSPIVALETEDHYVRIHSEAGSILLLIRMRDAVAEMDGVDGLQVHRSWWVARSAVTGHESDGRNLRLKLQGGLLVPVSRGSVQAVQDAGWLRVSLEQAKPAAPAA